MIVEGDIYQAHTEVLMHMQYKDFWGEKVECGRRETLNGCNEKTQEWAHISEAALAAPEHHSSLRVPLSTIHSSYSQCTSSASLTHFSALLNHNPTALLFHPKCLLPIVLLSASPAEKSPPPPPRYV